MAGGRRIRDDEAALWRRVARGVTPLSRRAAPADTEPPDVGTPGARPPAEPARKSPAKAAPRRASRPPSLPALDPAAPAGLDRRTARRLKRGQLRAEARIDLHGKIQDEAHAALARFIRECRMAGRRCVLVITGKGSVRSGRGGVLRQMAPRWLDEPALRRHVIAISTAPESEGGLGALYVLLKRRAASATPEPGPSNSGRGLE